MSTATIAMIMPIGTGMKHKLAIDAGACVGSGVAALVIVQNADLR